MVWTITPGNSTSGARSMGWAASQIQVGLQSSPDLQFQPGGTNRLNENTNRSSAAKTTCMSPRGVTNLAVSFAFNTTAQANGYHDLTVVVL